MTESMRVSDWPAVKTNIPQVWIDQLNKVKEAYGFPSMSDLLRGILRDFLQQKFERKQIFLPLKIYNMVEKQAQRVGTTVDEFVEKLILEKTRET